MGTVETFSVASARDLTTSCAGVDPDGVFLNEYTAKLFG
jgi:hypothetical protein